MKGVLKKTASILLSASLLTGLWGGFAPTSIAQAETRGKIQAEFFVSPSGDDKNPGTYEKPFATLQAARDAVRDINDNMTGDIYVLWTAESIIWRKHWY